MQRGKAGRYGLLAHGKTLTSTHIVELDDSEIEGLCARDEARLGAAMTKTLGSAALQLYAEVVSMFLPIPTENQPGLIATFELYHRYGMSHGCDPWCCLACQLLCVLCLVSPEQLYVARRTAVRFGLLESKDMIDHEVKS